MHPIQEDFLTMHYAKDHRTGYLFDLSDEEAHNTLLFRFLSVCLIILFCRTIL
ncbi:MAG: hypothetical protein Q8O92_10865 [Candidatus Latescibacter sp.]|nr:hypothetical protein [Candidatus Latescibacter sp.]